MKNKTWKIISAVGGVLLLIQLIYPFLLKWIASKMISSHQTIYDNNAASIGIIGGADGPTSILLLSNSFFNRHGMIAICFIIMVAPLIMIWIKKKGWI